MLDVRDSFEDYAATTAEQSRRQHHRPNLERLISAAVSNSNLATLLMQEPVRALAQFEVGRRLTPYERLLVLKIGKVNDIHEYAARLLRLMTQAHQSDSDEAQTKQGGQTTVGEQAAVPTPVRAPAASTQVPAPLQIHSL